MNQEKFCILFLIIVISQFGKENFKSINLNTDTVMNNICDRI